MMKTVKEIVKRERQKRRRRVGIMIVLIALCATAIFFGTKAYHNYKEEEFFKSVKEKEIKVTPKSITHKQTDIFTQSYQKENPHNLKIPAFLLRSYSQRSITLPLIVSVHLTRQHKNFLSYPDSSPLKFVFPALTSQFVL